MRTDLDDKHHANPVGIRCRLIDRLHPNSMLLEASLPTAANPVLMSQFVKRTKEAISKN